MEVSEFDPHIVWFNNALTVDFCKKVIRKFNEDEHRFEANPQINFMHSDYWQFQLAAQAHISSVLEKMSKYVL